MTALSSSAKRSSACTGWGCSQALKPSQRLVSRCLGSESMSLSHLSHSVEVAGLAMMALGERISTVVAFTCRQCKHQDACMMFRREES